MADPKTVEGVLVGLLVGDGATSETFSAFCGINAKTINFQTNTNERFLYDCNTPTNVPWRKLTKSGRFVSISGTGELDSSVLDRYMEAYNSNDPVNAQFNIGVAALDGGGYFAAAMMFTNLEIVATNGELVTVSISLESSGAVTWTDAS